MATIRDVAKAAGVSISTVSRAFNHYVDINGETKERIFEAARKLDYSPNISARNLSSKKRVNLGLIICDFLKEDANKDILFGHMKGAFRYAHENALDLALYITSTRDQGRLGYRSFCTEHSLSGTIISGLKTDDPYYSELSALHEQNCVTIDVDIPNPDVGIVTVDNRSAMRDLLLSLFAKGHRKIAVIEGRRTATVSCERMLGVEDAFREAGLSLEPSDIYTGDFSQETAYSLSREIASGRQGYTACVCFSDKMALGALRGFQDSGIRIPEDISLTGFDDIPLASTIRPALTTVRQDFEKAGWLAAKLLHEMTEGVATQRRILVPCPIVERGSTTIV